MRESSIRNPFASIAAGVGFALGCAGVAQAASVRVQVAEVRQDFVQMRELDLRLDESGAERNLHLVAAHLAIPSVSLAGSLDWDCALRRDGPDAWTCAGPLALQDASVGALDATLRVRIAEDRAELEFAHGDARATVQIPLSAGASVRAELTAVPVAWFDRVAKRYWAGGRLGGGRLDATIDLVADGAINARYDIARLAFDSRDGRTAGDQLALAGKLSVSADASPRIALDGDLRGGEILLGPFYAKWPATPVHFALDARASGAHGWRIDQFDWNDPNVLALQARATLDTAATHPLTRLDVELTRATLPAAANRYAATWLAAQGYDGLALSGALGATLGFDGAAIDRLAVNFDQVAARDPAGRFGITGVDGAIDWSAGGERAQTTLTWREAEFYRVALAAGALTFRSRDGRLALAQPADIGVFGGRLVLSELGLRPRADTGEQIGAGLALVGIDLAQLSSAFGWPAFSGTLGGAIPHIGYAGDVLTLDGGLLLDVFDGTVNVTRMSLERPFGVAPSLSADIAMAGIDLRKLTGVFSFGEITGRLDGRIDHLRLVDWKPVAFDASLRAESGGRISQRAIGSLSAVGGAGIGGGIQGMALKLFDTFGYARLGLDCRLADNVCHMDGIGAASGSGYTIVEGSGLPRITVVGFQHEVDWPTLVTRLVAATQGQGPEVR